MKASPVLAVLLVSASLGACALFPKHYSFAKIAPVSTPISQMDSPDDGLYADAVRAINARDYASALDLLEIARERNPNDIRVLNAFAVVYDKLGRFDLSARYYTLAAAVDPASEVVKQNLAYSALLQREASHEAAPALANLLPRPVSHGQLVQVAPGVVRLEGPIAPTPVLTMAPGITGHPLALVDASGGRAAEPVRLELARLGWTAPRFAVSSAPAQAHSEIVYPTNARVVALALARTLPQRVAMTVCADGCVGVRLVLGDDSVGWKHRGSRDATHRA